MLGNLCTTTLNNTEEMKAVKKKAQKFITALASCPMQKHNVWRLNNTVYIPSIRNSLGATAIEDDELEKIQTIKTTKILAQMGYISTFPQAVAFGPKHYGRIGLISLTSLILAEKVTILIRHLQSNSSIGKQLQILLDWIQLSAGTKLLLLEDKRELPHLEGKWIPHLRQKLQKINAHIQVLNMWTQLSQRENNQHIVDILVDAPDITDTQVTKADYYRKCYNVTTLADITSSNGTKIIPAILSGRQCFPQTQLIISNMEWPRQP
eukprot:11529430-Ditylum_brightwellii.AAC.1